MVHESDGSREQINNDDLDGKNEEYLFDEVGLVEQILARLIYKERFGLNLHESETPRPGRRSERELKSLIY